MAQAFHCFLSHNSSDKPGVRTLKAALAALGLRCWLDEEQLRPGLPWLSLLEDGIRACGAVAVCIGADGIGPWEREEMDAALRLAVCDRGLPVIPVLLPGAPAKPALPLMLAGRGWVDLRPGLTAAGLDGLVFGILGRRPGEAPALVGMAPEAELPSETRFIDEVLERLWSEPNLLLLAQEDRPIHDGPHAALTVLRRHAQSRFGPERCLHLVPPRAAEAADQAEFLGTLSRQAGLSEPARSAAALRSWLDGRLAGGELFILVSGLGKCSLDDRTRLAGVLSGLFDSAGDRLKVVLAGGLELAEMKYIHSATLSLLIAAVPLPWPELNTGDLMTIAARPPFALTVPAETAAELLAAAGGHPRLVLDGLRLLKDGRPWPACLQDLRLSSQIAAHFSVLGQDPGRAAALLGLLDQDDLGPYRDWIKDPLLRRLYWTNLLRADGVPARARLVWRCAAVREAGLRVLT